MLRPCAAWLSAIASTMICGCLSGDGARPRSSSDSPVPKTEVPSAREGSPSIADSKLIGLIKSGQFKEASDNAREAGGEAGGTQVAGWIDELNKCLLGGGGIGAALELEQKVGEKSIGERWEGARQALARRIRDELGSQIISMRLRDPSKWQDPPFELFIPHDVGKGGLGEVYLLGLEGLTRTASELSIRRKLFEEGLTELLTGGPQGRIGFLWSCRLLEAGAPLSAEARLAAAFRAFAKGEHARAKALAGETSGRASGPRDDFDVRARILQAAAGICMGSTLSADSKLPPPYDRLYPLLSNPAAVTAGAAIDDTQSPLPAWARYDLLRLRLRANRGLSEPDKKLLGEFANSRGFIGDAARLTLGVAVQDASDVESIAEGAASSYLRSVAAQILATWNGQNVLARTAQAVTANASLVEAWDARVSHLEQLQGKDPENATTNAIALQEAVECLARAERAREIRRARSSSGTIDVSATGLPAELALLVTADLERLDLRVEQPGPGAMSISISPGSTSTSAVVTFSAVRVGGAGKGVLPSREPNEVDLSGGLSAAAREVCLLFTRWAFADDERIDAELVEKVVAYGLDGLQYSVRSLAAEARLNNPELAAQLGEALGGVKNLNDLLRQFPKEMPRIFVTPEDAESAEIAGALVSYADRNAVGLELLDEPKKKLIRQRLGRMPRDSEFDGDDLYLRSNGSTLTALLERRAYGAGDRVVPEVRRHSFSVPCGVSRSSDASQAILRYLFDEYGFPGDWPKIALDPKAPEAFLGAVTRPELVRSFVLEMFRAPTLWINIDQASNGALDREANALQAELGASFRFSKGEADEAKGPRLTLRGSPGAVTATLERRGCRVELGGPQGDRVTSLATDVRALRVRLSSRPKADVALQPSNADAQSATRVTGLLLDVVDPFFAGEGGRPQFSITLATEPPEYVTLSVGEASFRVPEMFLAGEVADALAPGPRDQLLVTVREPGLGFSMPPDIESDPWTRAIAASLAPMTTDGGPTLSLWSATTSADTRVVVAFLGDPRAPSATARLTVSATETATAVAERFALMGRALQRPAARAEIVTHGRLSVTPEQRDLLSRAGSSAGATRLDLFEGPGDGAGIVVRMSGEINSFVTGHDVGDAAIRLRELGAGVREGVSLRSSEEKSKMPEIDVRVFKARLGKARLDEVPIGDASAPEKLTEELKRRGAGRGTRARMFIDGEDRIRLDPYMDLELSTGTSTVSLWISQPRSKDPAEDAETRLQERTLDWVSRLCTAPGGTGTVPMDRPYLSLLVPGLADVVADEPDGWAWIIGDIACVAGICVAEYLVVTESDRDAAYIRDGLIGTMIITRVASTIFAAARR